MNDSDYDVIVIGAGPVGLSAAIELGQRGVTCLVVERNDRVGYSPRAKTTNVRTNEHLRRWGIEGDLRAASPIRPDYPATVVFATRMNGSLLARFENAMNGSRARNDLYSAEAKWVPQYILEDVLRRHAQSLPGVEVRFGTEFRSVLETRDHVAVEIGDVGTGSVETIRARYLIGADGARSAVREAIGAKMTGDATALRNCSIIFRAPSLASRTSLGEAMMYWMVNADVPSLLGPMDSHGLWFFMATKVEAGADQDAVDLIRRGTGLHDLEIEIVGTDLWNARQLIADRYATSRIFLAGDSCHLHPPFGGFGMNMGISDSVDIGWKIAAVLQGWGGPDLLGTYWTERRAAHERTIQEAVSNYTTVGNEFVRPALEDAGPIGAATREEVADLIRLVKLREFKTLGLVLGMRYTGSPIILDAGHEPPPEHPMIYVPSSCPGCLAPHLWLDDGSSLYDHFGTGFTLLGTDEDAGKVATLVSAAADLGIPLKIVLRGDERLRRRYAAACYTLIRPDQHVAWRGDDIPGDPWNLLSRVAGHLALPAGSVVVDRPGSVTSPSSVDA